MFYLLKVVIEREAHTLDRPFSYAAAADTVPQKGERVEVDFAGRPTIGFIVDEPQPIEAELAEYNKTQPFAVKMIRRLIDPAPVMDDGMFELARRVADYYCAPLISVYKNMLPPSLKPASSYRAKPKAAYVKMIVLKDDKEGLSGNELKAVAKLKDLGGEAKFSGFGLKKTVAVLLAKGIVELTDRRIDRLAAYVRAPYEPKRLSDEQRRVYDAIAEGAERTYLIQGVTGSGKTEVFFRLAEKAQNENRGVLILEPEIALTSRLVTIFKSRFGDKVAVLHSGETPANLYDEYQRIARGEATIVIGARSAVFAPLRSLGLIVIDEEHVTSYKQENLPYYDARTVAMIRSELCSAKVVMCSATPTLETKARAERGIYRLLYLTRRYNEVPLPKVSIVDMADLKNIDSDSMFVSLPLRQAIADTLSRKKQVLLFLNRRGYAPVYSCRKCGRIIRCPNCDIPLTFHKDDNAIRCHHCGFEESAAALSCPACGAEVFGKTGFGTERAVDEVKRLFPAARIVRLDRDTAGRRHELALTLDAFKNREYDIMIGTQMIAKGHDFPAVELAAALMADKSLTIPNYRANEDTFDLLTQLIGRAGRVSGLGQAIIQTYMPDNEIIRLSAAQDYESFYRSELHKRQVFQYPPYTYLALITASGKDDSEVESFAYKIKSYLTASLKDARANIYGPTYPYIRRLNNRYFRTLMVKYKSRQQVQATFSGLRDLEDRDLKIALDIDPISEC